MSRKVKESVGQTHSFRVGADKIRADKIRADKIRADTGMCGG
jgi:hypothetical protein